MPAARGGLPGGRTLRLLSRRQTRSLRSGVLTRSLTRHASERPRHAVRATEPASGGDLLETRFRLRQHPSCGFHAQTFHESRRRDPFLAAEYAGEVPWAHPRCARELLHVQLLGQVLENPFL